MLKVISIFSLLVLLFSCQKKIIETPAPSPYNPVAPREEITCIYQQDCEAFDTASYKCFDTDEIKECDVFVELFEKLLDLPTAKCRRNTMAELGIVYYCAQRPGAILADIHFDRLGKLPTEKALKLYTSQKMRDQLFDHFSETHRKRSLRDEKNLGKTLLPSNLLPECMTWDENINFKETKQDRIIKGKNIKNHTWSIGETKDYILWAGDIDTKIIHKTAG